MQCVFDQNIEIAGKAELFGKPFEFVFYRLGFFVLRDFFEHGYCSAESS